jgi:hypothetical protein
MVISRKCQWLAVITMICVLSTIQAEQDARTKRELHFERATESIGLSDCPSGAKYVGDFHIVKDRRLRTWIFVISETSQWKQMSGAQRQLITKLQNEYRVTDNKFWRIGSPFSARSSYVRTPEGTVTYRVYGVSEQDVRKMAEGVIKWLDTQALKNVTFHQKSLDAQRNTIAEARMTLPKLEMESKRLVKQADEKIKEYTEVNYGVDPQTVFDHARESMEELARHLKTADFELVGLQARIDLIGKFKAGGKITDEATLIKLDQMLMADEIERAGVLARRSAYEAAFKLGKELCEAIVMRDKTSSQIMTCQKKMKDAEQAILMNEKTLADPPPEMRPVQVYENKVTIHPVRTDDK